MYGMYYYVVCVFELIGVAAQYIDHIAISVFHDAVNFFGVFAWIADTLHMLWQILANEIKVRFVFFLINWQTRQIESVFGAERGAQQGSFGSFLYVNWCIEYI